MLATFLKASEIELVSVYLLVVSYGYTNVKHISTGCGLDCSQ